MHVFEDGSYVGLNPIAHDRVNVSFVCRPEALRVQGPAGWLNERRQGSVLERLIPAVDSSDKFGTTFPATASVISPVSDHAALIGDASGFIDPLTGEGIYNALWSAQALAAALASNRNDIPLALISYAKTRHGTQRAKALLSHVFQGCISRPSVANAVLRLLAAKQGVADAFIGIIGNSYSPMRGVAGMLHYALAAGGRARPAFPISPCPPT